MSIVTNRDPQLKINICTASATRYLTQQLWKKSHPTTTPNWSASQSAFSPPPSHVLTACRRAISLPAAGAPDFFDQASLAPRLSARHPAAKKREQEARYSRLRACEAAVTINFPLDSVTIPPRIDGAQSSGLEEKRRATLSKGSVAAVCRWLVAGGMLGVGSRHARFCWWWGFSSAWRMSVFIELVLTIVINWGVALVRIIYFMSFQYNFSQG